MLGRTAVRAARGGPCSPPGVGAAAAAAPGLATLRAGRVRGTVLLALSPSQLVAVLRHVSAASSGGAVGGRRQVVVWAAAASSSRSASGGGKGAGAVVESGRAHRGPGSRASNPGQPVVVVVESPTKAKKIQGFLGDKYKVCVWGGGGGAGWCRMSAR